LISRKAAAEHALAIIDEEGLAALSIRRLAERMNINGASLYHHFENKNAIMVAAAELALGDVRTPRDDAGDWRDWLSSNARRARNGLLRHPNLIPILTQREALGIGFKQLGATAQRIADAGVAEALIPPLIDMLESLALANALHTVNRRPEPRKPLAIELADDKFDAVCRAVIDVLTEQPRETTAESVKAPWRRRVISKVGDAAARRISGNSS
jgi:TetR/AcrR family transcriptional regulator, tetracycline repressor protein